jgi:RNA polymerase sigma factor (sigma-70 family)
MSSNQQNRTEKLPSLLMRYRNYAKVQLSIMRQHPDLVAVASPFALRSDFDELVSACRPTLVETAWRIVRNRETAEDVVQEALRKAYANLKFGRPYVLPKNRVAPQPSQETRPKREKRASKNAEIENMEAWLQTIVRNVALNYLSSRHRQMNEEKKLSQLVDVEDTRKRFENPEALILRAEQNKELRDLVETLPPIYAASLRLRFFQEYDYQAIADELHCPLGTIKSSINRGLSMLGETLRVQRAVKNGRMVRRQKAVV